MKGGMDRKEDSIMQICGRKEKLKLVEAEKGTRINLRKKGKKIGNGKSMTKRKKLQKKGCTIQIWEQIQKRRFAWER